MTQTSASAITPDAAPMFPPGRYGRRREQRKRRRWALPVGVLIGVAIMSLITVKLYVEYGNEDFSPNVLSYTKITDNSITVTFSVDKPAGATATCTVTAYSYDDAQVGEADVPVPAGRNVQVTYVLATTGRAYIAEVPSCQAAN